VGRIAEGEIMGRTQIRLAVWALAILTAVAIFGDHTAFAEDNNQPRIEGGGWFPTPNPFARNGTAKVNFGITGKCDKSGSTTSGTSTTCMNPQGHFEYHNEASGLKSHGKVTSLEFHPATCGPIGAPAATLKGLCDDGTCSFQMEFADGGDPGKGNDWVCNVMVSGTNKMHNPDSDADPAEPLGGGNIKIRTND
jgi:hypothetical protein